jgi:hypothetical protein
MIAILFTVTTCLAPKEPKKIIHASGVNHWKEKQASHSTAESTDIFLPKWRALWG